MPFDPGSSSPFASLRGARVLVVGTGTIGRAVVEVFLGLGSSVVTWDRTPGTAGVDDRGGNVMGRFELDVTDDSSVAGVFASTVELLGGLDVVVNGAGVVLIQPIDRVTTDDWNQVLSTNLTASFLVSKAAIPVMAAGGGGSIVNIGSISGLRGEPELSHYSASKFGVIGLTQALAQECGPLNVRINCVCPGAVESPMNNRVIERDSRRLGQPPAAVRESLIRRTPLQRLCRPEDVAAAVLFFASDLSSFVTGESLSVAGGLR